MRRLDFRPQYRDWYIRPIQAKRVYKYRNAKKTLGRTHDTHGAHRMYGAHGTCMKHVVLVCCCCGDYFGLLIVLRGFQQWNPSGDILRRHLSELSPLTHREPVRLAAAFALSAAFAKLPGHTYRVDHSHPFRVSSTSWTLGQHFPRTDYYTFLENPGSELLIGHRGSSADKLCDVDRPRQKQKV